MPQLTIEQVAASVPATLKTAVTQQIVDDLNNIAGDPEFAEQVRGNFVSYSSVIKDGRFKLEDYFNAVKYVSYKLMGYNNEESYEKTFPARYARLAANGTSRKDISAYVAGYNKGKLVNLILEQTLIPTWVLNQDIYQRAINVQADLMMTAQSEKVRTDAANSILNHLKKPEGKEFQIKMDVAESSGLRQMQEAITNLAKQQKALIDQGNMKTIEVASSVLPIIDQE
jgi:hypothetical protein